MCQIFKLWGDSGHKFNKFLNFCLRFESWGDFDRKMQILDPDCGCRLASHKQRRKSSNLYVQNLDKIQDSKAILGHIFGICFYFESGSWGDVYDRSMTILEQTAGADWPPIRKSVILAISMSNFEPKFRIPRRFWDADLVIFSTFVWHSHYGATFEQNCDNFGAQLQVQIGYPTTHKQQHKWYDFWPRAGVADAS